MRLPAGSLALVIGSFTILTAQSQTGRQAPARADGTAVADVAKVRGRVVDADTGRPLRRVRVRAAPTRGTPDDYVTSMLTDATGTFELDVRSGMYVISAAKAGYETSAYGQKDRRVDAEAPLDLRQGSVRNGVDFVLRRGGIITGTVVDEFGEPIENATVQVARAQYADWQRQVVPVFLDYATQMRTDDLGRFRIFGLPAGEYYLSASSNPLLGRASNEIRDGYSLTYYPGTLSPTAAQPVRVATAQPVSGVIIPLVPTRLATISGTVETNGLPLPSGWVTLRPRSGGALGAISGMTAQLKSDDRFSFAGLPPGEYSVTVRSPGAADPPLGGSADVVLAGENIDRLVISLRRGVTLRGRITFEGALERPATPIQLYAQSLDAMFSAEAAVRPDGTFEIKGVQGNRVLLTVWRSEWQAKHLRLKNVDVIDESIAPDGRDVDDIELVLAQKLSELVGTVTDPQGKPLPSVHIVAFTENRNRWHSGTRYVTTVRSDASGRFTLSSLPPERYVIVAVEGFAPGDETNAEALERWARAGARVTLAENGTQVVQLRGLVR